MNYEETLNFMFTRLQAFHNVGATAYKPGLHTAYALSEAFSNPHTKFKSIHIAGTNGKGSTAHTIAAVLQSAGYKVGLYTSPHMLDFRERIRVNGQPIAKELVIDFIERYQHINADVDPSFFELTTIMAFEHFARENVDYAVIETGLGGRLDTTNIITPELSIITNISLDHIALLGDSIEKIATEKAGIIKPGVPVVIGESDAATRKVFADKAASVNAPITFAEDTDILTAHTDTPSFISYQTKSWGEVHGELVGGCQWLNARTIFTALDVLANRGFNITTQAVRTGFENVCSLTGLLGRWMKTSDAPLTVCDTGHNVGAWQYLGPRLKAVDKDLHIVIGFVNDKDITHILQFMPTSAKYYFVQPSNQRAAKSTDVASQAAKAGIVGETFDTVVDGYKKALADADKSSMIYVGGSTFVVADFLGFIAQQ
jgi:dihydrofolate synthase/folylpolyglutamate synthase